MQFKHGGNVRGGRKSVQLFLRNVPGRRYFSGMSVEQLEAAIEALTPDERRKLAHWFDDQRHKLIPDEVGDGLSEIQRVELLKRRREYDEHPERFIQMGAKSLDRMFTRIRKNVAARLPSAR
jgi:hypothetical protein